MPKISSLSKQIVLGLVLVASVVMTAQGISHAQTVAARHPKHSKRHHHRIHKPGVSRPSVKPVSGAVRPVSAPISRPSK